MNNRNRITCGCETCISDMLLPSYLNKWIISQSSKLNKLCINYASTRLLEISKNVFIEYKKQIFSNYSHIHLRACYSESSYHCFSPITGSKIPKWDWILNCCYECPMMNAPFLKSSEQINHFFPTSLHKTKFHIFQKYTNVWYTN